MEHEVPSERRKRLDRERYMRKRDERLVKQRKYYKQHREEILMKKLLRVEREREKLLKP